MRMGMGLGLSKRQRGEASGPALSLDLDSTAGGRGTSWTFTRGDSATQLTTDNVAIVDPGGLGLDNIKIVVSGVQDGANEVLAVGADTFPLNANKSTTELVGGVTFAIGYVTATQTFTLTNNAGGKFSTAAAIAAIEAITQVFSGTPTYGVRTFTFTIEADSVVSAPAVATVSVVDQVPVIDAIADTTATVGVEKTVAPNNSGGPATLWEITSGTGGSINPSTGVFTYTPSAEGTTNWTIRASNSGGSDTEDFAITSSIAPPVPDIPTDSMEAWYVLDEGTGTAITDSSGNGYDGTLNSATGAWGLTAQDGTPMLACSTSRMNYITTNVPFVNGSFSIVAVIMRTASATKGMVANHRQATSNFKGWYLFCENTNTIELDIDAGASTVICSMEALPLGVPVIVIGTFDSATGNVNLYANDGRSASASGATLGVPSSSSFQIGVNSGNTAVRWDGRIGDVIYYSKVLTTQERSDIFDNLWNKYYGTFAPSISTPDTQLTVTKHALPNDGNTSENTASLYTPLFATDNYFYAAAIDLRPGTYSRLFQLNKSDYSQNAFANISTASINSQFGHRGSAVVVTDAGRVLVHGHGHQAVDGWVGMHSAATGEDISSMSSTANPNSLTSASYHRMFKNPVNGSCFSMERNAALDTELYKWNDGTTSWSVVKAPLTQYFGGAASSYDAGLSFDSSGNMYLTAQCFQVTEGYPRCCIGVAKSTDDGANWTDLAGTAIATPISESELSTAFPLSTTIGGAEADHDAEGCWTIVTSTGAVLVFGGYRDEMAGDTYRSLYMAKWNDTGKYFTRHKLADVGVDHGGFNGKTAWYDSGKIYLLYTATDFHELANFPGGPYPDPGDTYLLVSDDDGETWTRYLVDDGTGTFKCYEAYGCPTSLAVDGVIRIMPCLLDSFDSSDDACEIWEVTPPSP